MDEGHTASGVGRKPVRLSRSMLVAVLSLVAATLFWAGNYVVGKIAIAELSPLSLVYLRWLLALVPLFLVAQVVERPLVAAGPACLALGAGAEPFRPCRVQLPALRGPAVHGCLSTPR